MFIRPYLISVLQRVRRGLLMILLASLVPAGAVRGEAGRGPTEILFADRFESLTLEQRGGTYLGLRSATVREIVFDSAGNAVLVGHFTADSSNDLSGATVIGNPSADSVFVAKYSPDGDVLWRTVVGGSGLDRGYGIDIDAADDLYIGGRTSSTDFPTTPGAFNRTHHGGVNNPVHGATDGYVFKLASDGSALVYSTLFGGSGQEGNRGGLAVDEAGSAYACGSVEGNSPDFLQNPSSGANVVFRNARPGGFSDAYVVKFSADGSGVDWARFYGSSNDTLGEELFVGCAIDSNGELRAVGNVWGDDAPTTDGSTFQGGNADLFTVTLGDEGQSLLQAGYVGTAGDEFLEHRLALGDDGTLHAAGATNATTFPVINAYRPVAGAGKNSHGVVMEFSSGGQLVFSSYVAGDGSGEETAFVAGPDAGDRVYLTGRTRSNDIAATADAFQPANAGGQDAYIQILGPGGNLLYASFIGGSGDDYGRYIAHSDISRRLFVAMETNSPDLPVFPGAANGSLHPAGEDVFVAAFSVPEAGRSSSSPEPAFSFGHPQPWGNPLNAVAFSPDDLNGWAVGIGGTVVRTVDGGDNWTPVPGTWNRLPDLMDVMALDAQSVVAAGGGAGVYVSDDGGMTWQAADIEIATRMNHLARIGDRLIVAGDRGVIAASDDGGRTWTRLASPGDASLSDQHWFSEDHGLVTAGALDAHQGYFARTSDGGANWQAITDAGPGPWHGLSFPDAQTGLSFGSFGSGRSDDGGENWHEADAFSFPPYVEEVIQLPDGTWLARAFIEGAEIHRSEDGGETWSFSYNSLAHLGVSELIRLGTGRLVAVLASGEIITSDDDGNTWQGRRNDLTDSDANRLSAVALRADGSGWAVGSASSTFGFEPVVLTTEDGGRNWRLASGPPGWRVFSDIAVSDAGVGYIVVYDAIEGTGLARTLDDGANWDFPTLPGGRQARAIDAPADGALFALAADEDGETSLWRSTNRGNDWTPADDGLAGLLDAARFDFSDSQTGLLLTENPRRMFRTEDGGQTWLPRSATGLGDSVYEIGLFDADFGLARCRDGLYRTTDGGETWRTAIPGHFAADLVIGQAGLAASVPHREGELYLTTDRGASWHARTIPWRDWNPRGSSLFLYVALGLAGDDLVIGGEYATLLHVDLSTALDDSD